MRIKRQNISNKGLLNGAHLKWIAIFSMLIDHIGAAILRFIKAPTGTLLNIGDLYFVSRQIGRLAFPIFAFLVVQGYQHTSKLNSYIRNMIIFALISQPVFSYAFYNQPFYTGHLNIFFTLTIGILGLALYEQFEERKQFVPQILTLLVAGGIGEWLNVDYGFYGVAFIMGLGILRHNRWMQFLFGVWMGLVQSPTASLAMVPIAFYNGERGNQNKWFFYLFYPVHLLALFLIRSYFL